jgi:protein SCO1/2
MKRSSHVWALAALGTVLAITACWWSLALWPTTDSTPAWLARTREVCFGATAAGLPTEGGWVLLIGQPVGMLIVLVAVWPAELAAGLRWLMTRAAGQVAVGIVTAAFFAGAGGVVVRVASVDSEPFSAGESRDIAAALTRVRDKAPAFRLTDQHGQVVSLDMFRGRPVIVTFAYGHCATVCPTVVADALEARRRLADASPALLVITLDPWRDTVGRLPSIAAAWRLTGDAHVLSGDPGEVDRALNGWRVPRVRNEKTGDLSHPALVYVVDRNGQIAYVVNGHADRIAAALQAL